MTTSFAVTWDYRCPFARNAHEHVLTALAGGAGWNVTFLPFSLGQVHVEEGQPSVWEQPEQDGGIIALQAGVLVRDEYPELFPAVHRALFAARHDHALKLDDPEIVRNVLREQGVDDQTVFDGIDSGDALKRVKSEHEQYVDSHTVWGVPTFIVEDRAVFVRLMHRAPIDADPGESIRTVNRVIDLLTWPDLNEFKHTSIPR